MNTRVDNINAIIDHDALEQGLQTNAEVGKLFLQMASK